MWNGVRHMETYHATAGSGVSLHTLNTRLSMADLTYIVNHAEDKLIIADADLIPVLEQLQPNIPSVKRFIIAAEPGFENWSTSLPNAVDYEEFIAGKPQKFDWL